MVIIIGDPVYYADDGHIIIFLLMSGDPTVLNHGDELVGQSVLAVLELTVLCFALIYTFDPLVQIILLPLCQQSGVASGFLLQRWEIWEDTVALLLLTRCGFLQHSCQC